MERLHPNCSQNLPDSVQRPQYDRDKTAIGIVHFGIGAFHRCHQAIYTEAVLNQWGGDWGICGVSLRSDTVSKQLNPQRGLYSCIVCDNENKYLQVVSAVKEVLLAKTECLQILQRLYCEQTKVITLTITEKGYCLDMHSGTLDENHPDIQHDLQNTSSPFTIYGYLVKAFQYRQQHQLPGLTVISCDNLSSNGKKLAQAIERFIELSAPDLWEWVADNVTFPATMVDRIVPATKETDKQFVLQQLGVCDEGCVVTEPFSQWVIEKKFATAVPCWDKVSAQFVDDVEPYEEMKLRLLNGSHSTIAYIGCLTGFPTVAKAIKNPEIQSFIKYLMAEELATTLSVPEEFDLAQYQQDLIERFANLGLQHLTKQIAMDGSQKIPQRLLPALRFHLQRGTACDGITLAIACWLRYLKGFDEHGEIYTLDDPLAETFTAINRSCSQDNEQRIRELLSLATLFGEDLPANALFTKKLLQCSKQLEDDGMLTTLRHFLKKTQSTDQ